MHAFVATYRLDGVTSAEHAELCEQLAPAMAAVPGLVSMTWLCNAPTGRYGGFYVFESKADFDRFVASELFAMLGERRGLVALEASDYAICAVPSATTRGPAKEPCAPGLLVANADGTRTNKASRSTRQTEADA